MTDPIGSMLIMIKNASRAKRDSISVPYSKVKQAVAECLLKEGYVGSVNKKIGKKFPVLEVGIKYEGKQPKVNDVTRISKPSRRMYLGVKEIKPVKNGYGLLVLSTPKGILSGSDARKEMVGGEVMFNIW